MLKIAMAVMAVLFSTNAFAQQQPLEKQVLELLIKEANNIQLQELGENSEAKLSEILASQLFLSQFESANRTILTSTSVNCVNTTSNRVGAISYECTVLLNNGDFRKSDTGFVGPETESSYILSKIKVFKAVVPEAQLQLSDRKVEISFAG